MSAIARRLAQAYPDNNAQDNVRLVPLRKSELGDTDRHLTWLTMGLAGFVLLIACANLANLHSCAPLGGLANSPFARRSAQVVFG